MNRSQANSRLVLLPVLLTLTFSVCASAQGPAARLPIGRSVTIIPKMGHRADFEAALKDYTAAYAKTPTPRARSVFEAVTGPAHYRVIMSYADWKDLAGPAAVSLGGAMARVMSHAESNHVEVVEVAPEFSTPPAQSDTMPAMLQVVRVRPIPGKTDEFLALVKSEVLPAYKKAGRSLTVRRIRFGGQTNEISMTTPLTDWADAGKNPVRDAMGAEAYSRMTGKLSALTAYRTRDLYRARPDLSLRPAR